MSKPATMTLSIPVSTGREGAHNYAEGKFDLELPTLTPEGFAWLREHFKPEEIVEGFVKSYVIAKQAVARKALAPEGSKPKGKSRGVFAQLNVK
jgi:hypothetical protein